ncbi:MAG: hypothetical protein ACFCGT_03095 [Sandaracinaceae bacterium]
MRAVLRASLIACLGLTSWPGGAPAQEPAAEREPLPDWIREHPFHDGADEDPIAIDGDDGLEAVSPTSPDEEVAPRVPVQHGDVLTAIPGVRELGHEVEVDLAQGLAAITYRLRFVSSASVPAELAYRLAVPRGASPIGLEVCNAAGCRRGREDRSAGPLGPYDDAVRGRSDRAAPRPSGHLAVAEDGEGTAAVLRVAPIDRSGPVTATVRVLVPAPVRGGAVRLALPARGSDPRAAPARIRVQSPALAGGSVDGQDAVETPVERAPWADAEVTARAVGGPALDVTAFRATCDGRPCTRVRAAAAPAPSTWRSVILLLDASPSTRGAARARIATVAGAIVNALPADARIRVAAFAAEAVAVQEVPVQPDGVAPAALARALEAPLGSATRIEAAWALVEDWARAEDRPVVVLLGDGGLTTTPDAERTIAAARATGASLAAVNVADRRASEGLLRLVGARHVLEVGAEAARAQRPGDDGPLRERLGALRSPVAVPRLRVHDGRRWRDLGPLRAGEERSWAGLGARIRIEAGARPRPIAPPPALRDVVAAAIRTRLGTQADALAAVDASLGAGDATCRLSGPVPARAGAIPAEAALVPAATRRCASPSTADGPADGGPTTVADTGVPGSSLLRMLQLRIVPLARGCFRTDRAGRADYHTRAVLRFDLADREVVAAAVEGDLAPALRACLLGAIDELDVPRFTGRIRVTYPLVTVAEAPPPTLELAPDVADLVDAVAREPAPGGPRGGRAPLEQDGGPRAQPD